MLNPVDEATDRRMAPPESSSAGLDALTALQRAAWASGDYGSIGTTLQIVGESLCEAVDLRAGWRVLDVAAGNGNCSLAAARRWCDVTSTDYVPALLEDGRRRAEADRLSIRFQEADAQALPFADGAFDAILSSFGVMFAADHVKAARELVRVCRPNGRIGLANWTPRGFIGQLWTVMARYVPPPPTLTPPSRWGMDDHLDHLFGASASDLHTTCRHFIFRLRSPEHWFDVFRTRYGPVRTLFEGLPADEQLSLEQDLLDLIARFNRSGDQTMVVPSEYCEVVIVRR